MYRVGVDVGGTFTDVVAVDDDGSVTLAKAASTPEDQSIGVMAGLERLAERLGVDLPGLFSQTERIVHGATVATNALLERKGAKVGLLTTEGHRDVLEMREGLKPDRYNLRMPPTPPLIPRRRRLGVKERMRPDGRVEVALDTASLNAAIQTLKQDEVEAVAICYLHAYKDAAHEQASAEAVRAAMPGVYITISAEVLPQIKEFERVSTTAVNAYVGPAVGRYLAQLEKRLQSGGYTGPVLIILSHGGVAPVTDTIRLAAGTVLSGPAGGVAGARRSAELLGVPDLIPFDMGGTSTDISLISGGEAALSSDRGVGGERVALPSLDIVSIASGGGSIARVDAGGVLHVGPQSAGAVPGPACYGRGGTQPTTTDASVVLGLLDAENFLGGAATLDMPAAEKAIDGLAEALNVDRMTAAEGVHTVLNTTMAEGVRLVSVRRGVDPRKFALLSFGGAAGVHITEIARALEVNRVFAPRVASVLSAWGMRATDLRFEAARSHIGDANALDASGLAELFQQLEREARLRLEQADFKGEVIIRPSADMRYGEQIFEIDVALDGLDFHSTNLMEEVARRFHARHEELFTYSLPDQEPVLVNARAAAIGVLPALPQEPSAPPSDPAPPRSHRKVYLGGAWIETPIYDFDTLAPGQEINGPAIIESETTTVVLRSGDRGVTTPFRWLDIAVGKGS
jgi:N-methylhydantoinase A